MPKKVYLEFVVQRLTNNNKWVVDLWDTISDEPLQDSNRIFDTQEAALQWCEDYRPGRYPDRTLTIHRN